MKPAYLWLLILLAICTIASAQSTPEPREADYIAKNFHFHGGETLPELRLHYYIWGTPKKNAAGEITNAVLLLHGTMGTGSDWAHGYRLKSGQSGLFDEGAALDAQKFFLIATDTIGAGKSSKPSDGLRSKFPHYNLEDIAAAEKLVVESLGVKHLRAILGSSMGGRQAWQWSIQYPEYMDALVPMISIPYPNAGRRALVDFLPVAIIEKDPAYMNGEYTRNPASAGIANDLYSMFLLGAGAWQQRLPTREAAAQYVSADPDSAPDANDFIYQLRLNDGFNAAAKIDTIKASVLMICMAGDLMVPAELGQAKQAAAKLKSGKYIEVREQFEFGHSALSRTVGVWGPQLKQWLATVPVRQ